MPLKWQMEEKTLQDFFFLPSLFRPYIFYFLFFGEYVEVLVCEFFMENILDGFLLSFYTY